MLLPLPIALNRGRYTKTEYVLQFEIQCHHQAVTIAQQAQGILQNNVIVELDSSRSFGSVAAAQSSMVAQNDARSTLMMVVSAVGQCIDYTCSRHS